MAAEITPIGARPLRILLLEDSQIDAELAISHLRKSETPLEIVQTATRREFIAALESQRFDVVLADYSLPDFDGLSALDIVRGRSPELPFLFVSGVVGEEFAINALRRGATDYVMKRGLNRLPAAVNRAVAEARERQERRRAERALRLSEINIQLAVEAAGLGKWEFDALTGQLKWDERCRELFGLTRDAPADHQAILQQCHVLDRERIDAALRAATDPHGSGKVSEECRIIRRNDGEERWLSLTGKAFFEGEMLTRFIGMVVDVTERKQAEAALLELNQTLTLRVAYQNAEREHLWQLSQDLLVVMDPNGILIEVNPAWRTLLGWPTDTVIGAHFTRFSHADDARATEDIVQRAALDRVRRFENRVRCNDGSYRWISWSTAPGHGCVYAVGRDINEEKEAAVRLAEAEQALRQAQKMEAVGQLTGGVAHDFNNLLQVVVGNLETLQRKLPPDLPRLRRAADNAMDGAQRAANLTQHLLAFSRRQPLNPRPVVINELVLGMSQMLERTLGELVEVVTVLAVDLWHVEVDANQLESALLNLAVNARDAMPEGGQLVIETFNVDDAQRPPNELPRGEYVAVTVRDTGSGMKPDVLTHAFEPFFTTKGVGQGTGLGLSQVYGFVTQSGGNVVIHSELEKGTAVKIYLPRYTGPPAQPQDPKPQQRTGVRPGATILVVEDDVDVRAYTAETIREIGYRVLEARDGPSTLKLLTQTPVGTIDLLFTDVVLPGGLNGQQLAQEALKLHPQLKVLFATGYARDAIVHHGRLDPGVQLIAKPFTYDDLAAALRSALDGTNQRH